MPKYRCPECESVLRREQPVPAGKKIKCPKCETVFAAKPLREEGEQEPAPKKARPKPEAAKKPAAQPAQAQIADDDDDDGQAYVVIKEQEPDKRKEDLYFGSLRDRYEKSKRGPAMAKCVVGSNFVLAEGLFVCCCGIALFLYSIWPFIFSDEPPKFRDRVWFTLGGIGVFGLGAFMGYCASQMHEVRYYILSWVGVILAFIPPLGALTFRIIQLSRANEMEAIDITITAILAIFCLFWVYGATRGVMALKDPVVREGFEEVAEEMANDRRARRHQRERELAEAEAEEEDEEDDED
jgi:predicted Zn finger-like uncharacterized protein